MEWVKGQLYHGFRLDEAEELTDIQGLGKVFYHEKSGARLFVLTNEDDNKVFSVTFRTLPQDDTGLAHILEHSVLGGSRNFPVKEPMVEMIKGSLNTFLNAMTYPDKTMYPIASRNHKDFRNLMSFYLDTVFYPNIYTTPETFMQEGWHYELTKPEDSLTYKGVVYNEMQGVFSEPDSIMAQKISQSLFPDTPYGFVSGGEPKAIPELSWEAFLQFHKTFYHPSNAYMFLYGDIDILKDLEYIDRAYLSDFSKTSIPDRSLLQPAFAKRCEQMFDYAIGEEEDAAGKVLMSLNYAVGQVTDAELLESADMLKFLLLGTDAAPLKKALLAAGIGKNVYGQFSRDTAQPSFSIVLSGTDESEKEKFVAVVESELQRLVDEGLDKTLIAAGLNAYEFTLREQNFGTLRGLEYNTRSLESWLYGKSPFSALNYAKIINKLRAALDTNYFEELIKTYLLKNTHQSLVILRPIPGLTTLRQETLRKHLAEYKASLSTEEISALIQQTEELQKWQQTPDSPENLAKLPVLALSDIDKQATELPLIETTAQGIPVLFHPEVTGGIHYITCYFDSRRVPEGDLPYVYLLAQLLGRMDTEHYTYMELASELNLHTGGIHFSADVHTENNNNETYLPKFTVKAKALTDKLPQLSQLLTEVLFHSCYQDRLRLYECIRQIKSGYEQSLMGRGLDFATVRALSYFSPAARYREIGMLTFYEFITELEHNFAAWATEIQDTLQRVAKLIFSRDNLLVGITADKADYALTDKALADFYGALPNTKEQVLEYQLPAASPREGFMTPGQVQYVVKAANFKQAGYAYRGSMKVVEAILSFDYLWTRVRMQGGAYGSGVSIQPNGNMMFTSYRDPNLKETLETYDEAAAYLGQLSLSSEEITKYIIGIINKMDAPLTPDQKGDTAMRRYIMKLSAEEVQKERDEVLSTTPEDIGRLAEVLTILAREKYVCVFGSEEKIKNEAGLFDEIKPVFS
jgi:Zn-dependent M16 (insulinase) family peptidase